MTANLEQAQVVNAALKRKQDDAVLEMTEQIDALQKLKAKIGRNNMAGAEQRSSQIILLWLML